MDQPMCPPVSWKMISGGDDRIALGGTVSLKKFVIGLLFTLVLGIAVGAVYLSDIRSLRYSAGAVCGTVAALATYYVAAVIFQKIEGKRQYLLMGPAGAIGGIVFGFVLGFDLLISGVVGFFAFPAAALCEYMGRKIGATH